MANISTPRTVKLMQRERNDHLGTWKEHIFILLSLFNCAVETRFIVYRPTGHLYALRVFLKF